MGLKFNRNMYKELKKYDRQEMEDFLIRVYQNAYNDAVKDLVKEYERRFKATIENTKGCGPVMQARLIGQWDGESI